MELNGKKLENFSRQDLIALKSKAGELIQIKVQQEEDEILENFVELVRKKKIPYAKIMRVLREGNAIISPLDSEGYASPIYYNPKNPTEVYDGHGRRPNWVKKLGDQGINMKEYIINKDAYFNPNMN
ncbi:H-NS histone family protein [Acinetobacter radioresistens]|uniref:H-NS family nucleoid-associated regulatory protein n=1 Tax=Acinetobacter radioresistens TaxID=40216 RepID=UPI002004752C|nr:H-NS family nucleoid-associated regulatory protein [Acinetobacter radioresistens]MCK4083723.1 H-NS histone family protein [Acinetobacter radioresistens]